MHTQKFTRDSCVSVFVISSPMEDLNPPVILIATFLKIKVATSIQSYNITLCKLMPAQASIFLSRRPLFGTRMWTICYEIIYRSKFEVVLQV
jgi:hypothetical protein